MSPWRSGADDEWSEVLSKPATCTRGKRHAAPAPGCWCGYRIVDDLYDLVDWVPVKYWRKGLVFGRVCGEGLVLPGYGTPAGILGDPPNTWRAEQVRITGPLHPIRATRHLVGPVAERYGLTVGKDVRRRYGAVPLCKATWEGWDQQLVNLNQD